MTEQNAALPRKTPCASCPYRCGVPSGVWHEDEYAKLARYDRPMHEQPPAAFMCHQGEGDVCSGWLGHADPNDLLAVRVGIIGGRLDPACAEYTTTVPLFSSGADAAAHGTRDVSSPGRRARDTIRKVVATRASAAAGPVTTGMEGLDERAS